MMTSSELEQHKLVVFGIVTNDLKHPETKAVCDKLEGIDLIAFICGLAVRACVEVIRNHEEAEVLH